MKLDFKGIFPILGVSALVSTLLLAGCAPRVYVEQDSAAQFTGYHSYAWVSPSLAGPVRDPILDSQILEDRVQRAVAADLKTRGYLAAPAAGSADFLVTYHTVSKQKIESGGAGMGFGFVDAFPRGFGGAVIMAPPVESREEGTLMLDVIDGKSKRLVWRGWTSGWLNQDNYTDQAVAAAVQQIFDKFPAH
ncbi:MAG TPA: DUF4136 domain-containing protein [Gammaproteobacteria bacterium]|jgi:hypothetical protein|nr:DUF4136 domain-containing protein [Gammaproteobacteria bacterium]